MKKQILALSITFFLVQSSLIFVFAQESGNNTTNVVSNNEIKRSPETRKDYANVFYKSVYTLFDLYTDEPIFIESDGYFHIYIASNENKAPNELVCSKMDLESKLYYKFKNYQNCKDWCDGKSFTGSQNTIQDIQQIISDTKIERIETENDSLSYALGINSGFRVRLGMSEISGGENKIDSIIYGFKLGLMNMVERSYVLGLRYGLNLIDNYNMLSVSDYNTFSRDQILNKDLARKGFENGFYKTLLMKEQIVAAKNYIKYFDPKSKKESFQKSKNGDILGKYLHIKYTNMPKKDINTNPFLIASYALGLNIGNVFSENIDIISGGINKKDSILSGFKTGLGELLPKSYVLGLSYGSEIPAQFKTLTDSSEVNKELVLIAFEQALKQNSTSTFNIQDADSYLSNYQSKSKKEAIAANAQFLVANKSKKGVKTTASGLQYKVIFRGTGARPSVTDNVIVKYRGTLINGTVFDKNYQGTSFPLNGVIKGWSEGLQMMPVGSKYMLYVPYNLGYGVTETQMIKPYSTLIYEVELISIRRK